jgi:putative DNA primase/helicase
VGENRRSAAEATPDLVPLIGARLVRMSEPEEGARLNEPRIKEMTGGEKVLIRGLNKEFVEISPVCKFWVSTNHKPDVRGTDDGIWRRLCLIPWDVQIPKDERDPQLFAKIMANPDGVFAWMVEGLLEYLEVGLAEPDEVKAATQEYREESDPIGTFLDLNCVVSGETSDVVSSKDLTEAFNFWRREDGTGVWGEKTVARKFAEKASRWRSPKTGQMYTAFKSSISQYRGIRFTDMFKRRFDERPIAGGSWSRRSAEADE